MYWSDDSYSKYADSLTHASRETHNDMSPDNTTSRTCNALPQTATVQHLKRPHSQTTHDQTLPKGRWGQGEGRGTRHTYLSPRGTTDIPLTSATSTASEDTNCTLGGLVSSLSTTRHTVSLWSTPHAKTTLPSVYTPVNAALATHRRTPVRTATRSEPPSAGRDEGVKQIPI